MESGGSYGMPPGFYFGRYKKGGTVKKTGPALVHKGEKIIPARKNKRRSSR